MLNRLVRSIAPALVLATLPVASFAGIAVGVSINIAPPALPVYVQPAPPGADYIWTPGYWAWGDDGYYWVPGTWALAPQPGLLWTPGYWGWVDGAYIWHAGYWGPHIGFYGGVNYGFGYTGVGFAGAYWRGGHVVYNRAVTNVTNINVTNVYTKTVVVKNVSHVSFNGGNGGILARASASQLAAEHEHHFNPTPMQRQHLEMAAKDRDLRASVNSGRPHIAATARPASFSGRGVVAARATGGEFHPAVAHEPGPHPGTPSAAHVPVHGPAMTERNDRPPGPQREGIQRNDRPSPAQHEAQQGAPGHAPPHAPPQHGQPGMAKPEPHAGGPSQPHMARVEPAQGRPPGGPAAGGQPHPQPNAGAPHGEGPHPGGGGGHPEGQEGRGHEHQQR